MFRLIIAGGGLAGGLAALAMARRRPEVSVVLVEQGERFGGNHTWSFFDSDVADDQRWVLEGIDASHWPDHQIRFPKRRRTIGIGYNSIRSQGLDRALRSALVPERYRLSAAITDVGTASVGLAGGERVEGDAVIDARGPGPMPGLDLAWQKFVGRYYRFDRPHGRQSPMIMDATVEQTDGYRFIYSLPVSANEMLVEDTYYSAEPTLDRSAVGGRVEAAAAGLSDGERQLVEEESGVLPIVLDGGIEAFWAGAEVARLGIRGGFFHPTTSYSLPDAVANAALLTEQRDLSTRALMSLFRARADRLWSERSFFRLLNRLLFRAADPDQSYRVLEHFYRLPPEVIARFYAARLTGLDKVRILSGRPPVPIGRAVRTLFGSAA